MAGLARARHDHLAGRLEDYEVLAREFLARAVEGGDEQAKHASAALMLYLSRERGRLGELSEVVERAESVVRATGDAIELSLNWRCALAPANVELDRRTEARRELETLACNDFSDFPRDWAWLVNVSSLSEVVAFLDDAPRAELLYNLFVPYAERCVGGYMPFCHGSASRPLGLLATTMERFDAAARHFEDALEMNTRLRSPLWVAHTQYDYARMLLRRGEAGDRQHALELLAAGLATADELGLRALADGALRLKRQEA